MKAVPQSFDFGHNPLRPDFVVKTSYGNDSIALIQWLHEYDLKHSLGRVVCLFNDTGWAADWWMKRVDNAEENLVKKYGFIPSRTSCIGMRKLIVQKNAWPNMLARFCTEELKIVPTHNWLIVHDVEGLAEMVCGVRREESQDRAAWPEYVPASDKNEGRAEWSPMVEVKKVERDALVLRAGFQVLPHRSRECRCVLANSTDLKTWTEGDIKDIEEQEAILGQRQRQTNNFMFRPNDKRGRPHGIRAVVAWAHGVKTKEPARSGCDGGYCVS
jgi:3'-phosphoadenosine 5'-phosphosulfate sulfotransferase (PAPS reductase)/FAD synthetase